MKIGLVLVDSSSWIDAFRAPCDEIYRQRFDQLMLDGRIAVCEVVIAEVLRGAVDQAARERMSDEFAALTCLDMQGAGNIAGRLALELRARGLAINTTDLLIAATAELHGVPILHRDRHLSQAASVLGLEEYQLTD